MYSHRTSPLTTAASSSNIAPSHTRKLRRSGAVLALVGAIGLLTPTAAMAATPVEKTVYSSETSGGAGAEGHVKANFYAADRVDITWENKDIKSDGRGAIIFIREFRKDQQTGAGTVVVYDHNTSGTGFTDTGFKSIDENATSIFQYIPYITVTECNGGSRTDPIFCSSAIKFENPYYS